jgi:hypothetical protein
MGSSPSAPNRPKTFARNLTIPQKVTNVSIYDKMDGIPIRIPARLVPRSGRVGGGKPRPDDGQLNLALWPLDVVNAC